METSISIFKIAVVLDHRVTRARQRLISPFLAATCGSPGHVTPKKFLSSGSNGLFHLTQILVSFQPLRLNIPVPRRYYPSFLDMPDSQMIGRSLMSDAVNIPGLPGLDSLSLGALFFAVWSKGQLHHLGAF